LSTELSFRSFQESTFFKDLKKHATLLLALHTETADFFDKSAVPEVGAMRLIEPSSIEALLSKIDITLAGWDEALDEFEEFFRHVMPELPAPFSNIVTFPRPERAICLNIDEDLEEVFDARAQLYKLYQYFIDLQNERPLSETQ
jgi:hypothetical protein